MNIHLSNHKNKSVNNNGSRPFAIRSLANESGAALIVALLLMVVMITLIPVALQLTTGEFERTKSFQEEQEALAMAEAGLERAKSIIQSNLIEDVLNGTDTNILATADNGLFTNAAGTPATEIDPSTTVNATSKIDGGTHAYTQVAYNGGNYLIRVWDNDDAALCPKDAALVSLCTSGNTVNDLNSDLEPWNDRDGFLNVESIGMTPQQTSITTYAQVKRRIFPPSTFPSAVTLVGPVSDITSTGSGFNVEGGKTVGASVDDGFGLSNSGDDQCPAANGIATESAGPPDDPCTAFSTTCTTFAGGAETKIKGKDSGSPDLQTSQDDFTAEDSQELWDLLTEPGVPDEVFNGPKTGGNKITGSEPTGSTWGSAGSPVVYYFDDDVDIGGNITGYGVLIVDGDLDINGSLDWFGVILIGACSTCDGALVGTGSATIYGAMVVGNSVDAAVNFTGNAIIRYSCQAIDLANNVFDFTFDTVSWRTVE